MSASFDYAQDKQNLNRGFTLVELLVVITIIAILSVIGMVVFTGVQKGARDARRRADIDSIVKAMEVNYGRFTPGVYPGLCQVSSTPTYDCKQWFVNDLPQDPLNRPADGYAYCFTYGAPICDGTSNFIVASGAPQGGAILRFCAKLEASSGSYCISTSQ